MKYRLHDGTEIEVTRATGAMAERMWQRLTDKGLIPHASELAPLLGPGKVAVLVFEPNDTVKDALFPLGWDGKAAVFQMSKSVARRYAKLSDPVTAAWLMRDSSPGRLLVFWGLGSVLMNWTPGRGLTIEPGSIETDQN